MAAILSRIGSALLVCAAPVCACDVHEEGGSAVAGVSTSEVATSPESARALRRTLRGKRDVELGSFVTQKWSSSLFPSAEQPPRFTSRLFEAGVPTRPSTSGSAFVVPSPITPMDDGSGRYVMRQPTFATFFTPNGFAFALSSPVSRERDRGAALTHGSRQGWGLFCTLVGAREGALVAGEEQPARVRQYRGGSRSTRELPTYGRLAWEEIYPGVDMVAETTRGALAYGFVLSPGARVSDLVMRWSGATVVRSLDDGRGFDVETGIGVLRVRGLRAFAVEGERLVELAARYVVYESAPGDVPERDVALQVDGWNGRTQLVIDPTIGWSSYLGGDASQEDTGYGIATDGNGNIFLTGVTSSTDFPSSGGFDATLGGGSDTFVTKVSGAGVLLWSSYLGGSSWDHGRDIAVDGSGNAFVTGLTSSTDFPSSGGFDTTFGGGLNDAFLTKVSGAGALVWSSYLGGGAVDDGRGVAVDGSGNAFLTGTTQSTDFPTSGGFDTTFGGAQDAFVTKVSGSGAFLWSSYFGGGAGSEGDGITVDGSGNVLFTGATEAVGPTSGGDQDAFVTKVSGAGALVWSSYFGGSSSEFGSDVAFDGNVFVKGYTNSTDFPASGGFDTTPNGGYDVFVAKLSGVGVFLWSSYVGGGLDEIDGSKGIAVDGSDNAFVTGSTQSADFPTSGGFDTTFGGGYDAFVTKVSGTGALLWSSYLGGGSVDFASAVAVDGTGSAFVMGSTSSTDFPISGGFDNTLVPGDVKAFVTKLAFAPLGTPCGTASDCQTSLCIDGVCCDKPCASACEACTAAKKGAGSDGTCGASCCVTTADCNDGDPCTTDTCDTTGQCAHTAVAACCTLNAQCDDGDPCTTDSCNLTATQCVNAPITPCADAGSGGTSGAGGAATGGTAGAATGGAAGASTGGAAGSATGGTAGAATGGAAGASTGGTTSSGGTDGNNDAGATDAAADAGKPPPSNEGGCGCRVLRADPDPPPALVWLMAGCAVLLRRARRRRWCSLLHRRGHVRDSVRPVRAAG